MYLNGTLVRRCVLLLCKALPTVPPPHPSAQPLTSTHHTALHRHRDAVHVQPCLSSWLVIRRHQGHGRNNVRVHRRGQQGRGVLWVCFVCAPCTVRCVCVNPVATLAQIRVWNTARSADAIAATMHSTLSSLPAPDGLVMNVAFENVTGNHIADSVTGSVREGEQCASLLEPTTRFFSSSLLPCFIFALGSARPKVCLSV